MKNVQLPTIPWEMFSEEEIHFIIQRACESNGWEVYNTHSIQRTAEHGADLIVTKDDGIRVAIAVKIKPRSQDRAQLLDLARRPEKEKIYIYIKDPTPDFVNEMKTYANQINFFDKNKLNKWIFDLNPHIFSSLVIDSHKFSLKLLEIQKSLIKFFYESTKGNVKPVRTQLGEELLRILWRLKDETASLNKTFRSFQLMFEVSKEKEPEPQKDVIFLNGFINVLDNFYTSALFINRFINKFWEENKNFVSYVIQKTEDRSNWKGILFFEIYAPDFLKNKKNIEEEKQLLEWISKKSGKSMKELLTDEKRYNISHSLAETCRILANFIDCIESFIDDLFSYGIFDEYHTYLFHEDETSEESENKPPTWGFKKPNH